MKRFHMKWTMTLGAFTAYGLHAHAAFVTMTTPLDVQDDPYNPTASTVEVKGMGNLPAGSQLQVNLQIVGEWNGDLYAYLSHNGKIAILLNRPGKSAGKVAGYDDSGLNVTFQDDYTDIHGYRGGSPDKPLSGTLQGIWGPDGRKVDPNTIMGTEKRTDLLNSFDGASLDGKWTLFVADMSKGSAQRLESWSLDVVGTPIPEPSTYLAGLGALGMLGLSVWKSR